MMNAEPLTSGHLVLDYKGIFSALLLRQLTRDTNEMLTQRGFAETSIRRVITIAHEMAHNIFRHAFRGEGHILIKEQADNSVFIHTENTVTLIQRKRILATIENFPSGNELQRICVMNKLRSSNGTNDTPKLGLCWMMRKSVRAPEITFIPKGHYSRFLLDVHLRGERH